VLSKVADREIPDFNFAGYTSELSAGGLASTLPFYVLSASLAIDPADDMGMFAGDYKAYLTYMNSAGEGKWINLLDRIGASAGEPEGSAANGIEATFSDYGTGQAINSATGDPIAGTFQPGSGNTLLQGTMGAISSAGKFFLTVGDLSEGGLGVLDSWSVSLVQRVKMSVLGGVGKNLSLISGVAGTAIDGTLWDVGKANLKFMSAGFMAVNDSEFYNLGSELRFESAQDLSLNGIGVRGEAAGESDVTLATRGSLTLENSKLLVNGDLTATAAVGPVELNGEAGDVLIEAARNVVISGADLIETSAGGPATPATPDSLAVIRTGDSLELRNVTIRNFERTKLEKVQNGVTTGRVLISGSSVRDFKIKELTGMAVNADAKIQMAAYDSAGRLEGEMVVENQLPVATKLASQIDNTITGTLGNTLVHAKEVELAARTVRFNDATIAAMSAITARANTILIQNSFMTVVQNTGMINMYVQSGLVNRDSYSNVASLAYQSGQLNFSGSNRFKIGSVLDLTIANGSDIATAMSGPNPRMQEVSVPQAGKVNVLKM
jgi:hypothetical protein